MRDLRREFADGRHLPAALYLGHRLTDAISHQSEGTGETSHLIAARLRERCQKEVRGGLVTAFGGPPIEGLGTTGGFKLIVEDRGNLGMGELQRVTEQVVSRGNRTRGLRGLFTGSDSPVSTPGRILHYDLEVSAFAAVPGGWGRKGATQVRLPAASPPTVGPALLAVWRNVAPKKLLKEIGG